jgi:hypothetical protein
LASSADDERRRVRGERGDDDGERGDDEAETLRARTGLFANPTSLSWRTSAERRDGVDFVVTAGSISLSPL